MLDGKYNASESEKKWQEYWQSEKIYTYDNESNKSTYSVDTPPPTVNGKIHIGHIFSYTQAEVMARYMRMKGYNVFYPFGFDDNGLPTERLVEKNYEIKAHEVGREKFTELCLNTTSELEKQFKELFISAGFSCDWNHEYSTINEKSQVTSQYSFIDLYNKGLVYHEEAPALWCTECQTAIAQAELETKELESIFNYLYFDLANDEGKIEIATTRPELLPACQCIFVNPDDEKNAKLIGKKAIVPLFGFEVPILGDEKVEKDKGTGIVMCCTFGDLTDLDWYKKYNLKFKEAILSNGKMSNLCGKYEGMYVKKARNAIIEDLKEQGYLFKQERIKHNVSVHERCGQPMEIGIKNQWFIDILSHKKDFIDAGNKINWYPNHMKHRYINWVENLEWDWCISRQRYFGVPFPVWYCKKCGKPIIAELEDLPVNPLVDSPKKPCQCGCNEFIPETDVMDTWATSSVSPLINMDWIKNGLKVELPMSLRPNAHDIIRTWDFYTIVKSLYHTGEIPWENAMISGHVLIDKKEKVSKRKNNSKLEPEEVIKEFSADAVRYWATSGSLGQDILFSEEKMRNGKKLINKIWNASKFVLMHMSDFDINRNVVLLPMDKWIINKYNVMFDNFSKYMEKYELGLALNELEHFFWDFCDNYIEIVKNRLYKPEIYGYEAKYSGQKSSFYVLFGMLQLFAIYMPHITEEIYMNYFNQFFKEKSIHLTSIGKIEMGCSDDILKNGDAAVEVISRVRRYKSENNLSLKTEIDSITLYSPINNYLKSVEDDIKATTNVSRILYETSESLEVIINDK